MKWPECCGEVAVLVRHQAGEVIHKRGDLKPGLTVILKGKVKVGNYGLDGRYYLTTYLHAGDMFGEFTLFADLPRTHDAETVTSVELYQLSPEQFEQMCQRYPELSRRIMRDMAQKLHASLEALDDHRRLPVRVRLAKQLWHLSNRSKSSMLTMRQSDLADAMGVTVLAIHKGLKDFAKRGIISLGYGKVEIIDRKALRHFVERKAQLLPVKKLDEN